MRGKYRRKKQNRYKRIIEKYKDNPVLYVEEVLGVKLLDYQKILLRMLNEDKNLMCKRRWS